jgi:hypothetical protein
MKLFIEYGVKGAKISWSIFRSGWLLVPSCYLVLGYFLQNAIFRILFINIGFLYVGQIPLIYQLGISW